jgi:hypothetical protein
MLFNDCYHVTIVLGLITSSHMIRGLIAFPTLIAFHPLRILEFARIGAHIIDGIFLLHCILTHIGEFFLLSITNLK